MALNSISIATVVTKLIVQQDYKKEIIYQVVNQNLTICRQTRKEPGENPVDIMSSYTRPITLRHRTD